LRRGSAHSKRKRRPGCPGRRGELRQFSCADCRRPGRRLSVAQNAGAQIEEVAREFKAAKAGDPAALAQLLSTLKESAGSRDALADAILNHHQNERAAWDYLAARVNDLDARLQNAVNHPH